jgi:hypothetical protein
VRTKTILSQFVASVQLTSVPLHVAIGEIELGRDVGVGQTIGMGCEKFQDRKLPFLRTCHVGNCSTRSYSGVASKSESSSDTGTTIATRCPISGFSATSTE